MMAANEDDIEVPMKDVTHRDNPFEERQGKTLSWKSITMKVKKGQKDAEDKIILENVWGEVPNHETTAIMGPSGAGKTSLLNVLAGRAKSSGSMEIKADIRLDNIRVDPNSIMIRKQIAFVAQDDSLHTASTPRECIRFSAKLRLPKSVTDEELDALTDRMIQELGLTSCADTIVGSELLKGISGGERKRTSVGVELVTKPAMVFLDEPTSGLDSFSALQLSQVLKKVANAGASVMFTIHQPASDIFDSFDHLILLNKGRVMYQGSVHAVADYFGARSHPLPPKYNPADWIMIVAQSVPENELEQVGFYGGDQRQDLDATEALDNNSLVLSKQKMSNHVGFTAQLGMLINRDLNAIRRDKFILGARIMLTGFMSIISGIIFWQVAGTNAADSSDLQSHFGAEVIVLMSAMFGSALPALIVFPQERPVFVREYSTNHYSAASYFLSRLCMEAMLSAMQMFALAILSYFMINFQLGFGNHYAIIYSLSMTSTAIATLVGSSVKDPKLAIEFLPMCFVPQLLFSGFFVAPRLIPVWLRWLQWVMPLTYSVRLHMAEEFGRPCGSPQGDLNCMNLLTNAGVDVDDVWWYWVVLVGLFVVLRGCALIVLRGKATQFY